MSLTFEVSAEMLTATRESLVSGITLRINHEIENNKDERKLASIVDTLQNYRKRADKLDAATLAYAASKAIDFSACFLSVRNAGHAMNVYAMPKGWGVCSVLNGAAFPTSSDGNTLAAAVLAIHAKASGKAAHAFINDLCSKWGMGSGTYTSGATQGGSSRRAMHALGIIDDTEGSEVKITDKAAFDVLLKAARAHDKRMSK